MSPCTSGEIVPQETAVRFDPGVAVDTVFDRCDTAKQERREAEKQNDHVCAARPRNVLDDLHIFWITYKKKLAQQLESCSVYVCLHVPSLSKTMPTLSQQSESTHARGQIHTSY